MKFVYVPFWVILKFHTNLTFLGPCSLFPTTPHPIPSFHITDVIRTLASLLDCSSRNPQFTRKSGSPNVCPSRGPGKGAFRIAEWYPRIQDRQ